MTFTIDDAQGTYEADTNGMKRLLVTFAQHQALTKTVSNSLRFQEHSDNIPTAHDSQRGWVVVGLDENERSNSNHHACRKTSLVVELNFDCKWNLCDE